MAPIDATTGYAPYSGVHAPQLSDSRVQTRSVTVIPAESTPPVGRKRPGFPRVIRETPARKSFSVYEFHRRVPAPPIMLLFGPGVDGYDVDSAQVQ